jgi:predicted TIM-barrel fold metal-dependent hydrolase
VRIIDTHTHVVSRDQVAYPLRPSGSAAWYRDAPHTAEDLLERMDATGVAGAVLVQGVGAYSFDNRYAADSAARHPGRFTSACCVDVDGEDPVGALSYWVRERGMRGVRLFALSGGRSWLAEPRTFPLWERAAELGAHVIVTLFYHQLPELRAVLERFPEVPVSVDHCAFLPPGREPTELHGLAELENLHLKVTTLVLDGVEASGVDPGTFVRGLVGRFGARRVMWGSDFCQTHDRGYGELVNLARRAFATLSDEEQAWCLGRTAARLWPALGEAVRS